MAISICTPAQLELLTSQLLAAPLGSPSFASVIPQVESALAQLKLKHLYQQVLAESPWDFYPTPQPIIEKMLALASLRAGIRVLEPQAGFAHICCELRQQGIEPDCFEIHPLLREALQLQDFNLIGDDFLTATPVARYDRIIANPPFSRNGVANHTVKALDWLKPKGKLITLAHHYRLNPSRSDRAFFDWLRTMKAKFINCGTAFESSDRPTSVLVQIIVITKPGI